MKQEHVEIYHQLRQTCHDLQRKKDNSGNFNSTQDSGILATPEEINVNQIRVGMLRSVMRELQSLLNDSNLDYSDVVIFLYSILLIVSDNVLISHAGSHVSHVKLLLMKEMNWKSCEKLLLIKTKSSSENVMKSID